MLQSSGPVRIVLAAAHFAEGPDAVPLGAACIASALKAAFPARSDGILAFLAEVFVREGAAALTEKILAHKPGGAGFSLYSWNRSLMVEAAFALRQKSPGTFLFCGGPEATALPRGLHREQGGPFDALIPGEGEAAVTALIRERFFSAPGQALSPGPALAPPPTPLSEAALAKLPSPWLDSTLSVRPGSSVPVSSVPQGGSSVPGSSVPRGVLWELTRGCPYNCAYCYESRGLGKNPGEQRVRRFPPGRLREELRLFIREEAPYVFVLDPVFNMDDKRAVRFLDMIDKETKEISGAGKHRGRKPPVHWHFEVRGELITRAQARGFARLGASLQIGLQTADPKTAALIGRGFDRQTFCSRINILNQEGVIFGLDLIYGLPGDSPGGYRKSLDFALSLYPNNLDLFRLSLLPGTALAEKADDYNLTAEDSPPYGVISTPDFSAPEMDRAEALSRGTDLFYNRGRAVAWFNQALGPLKLRPSVFLERFTGSRPDPDTEDSLTIEKMQLSFLEEQYRLKKKEKLLPALRDIVRYHGAWGRALAEGKDTEIDFTYDPDTVLGPAALDLESFAASVKPRPRRLRVRPV